MSRQSNYMKLKLAEDSMNTYRYSEVDLLSTQGRMGGKMYFFYTSIITLLLIGMFTGTATIISHFNNLTTASVYALLAAISVLGLFAIVHLTIQRCHDFNGSNWLPILAVIPFANIIFSLISGNNGLNQYGERPQPSSLLMNLAIIILIGLMGAMAAYFYTLS